MSLFDSYRGGRRAPSNEDRVLRVAELARAVRASLEGGFAEVWVEGEIADFTRSAQGHLYFTLSDESEPAQLRCVMFRSDAMRSRAPLRTGARVRLRARATLYEQRGTFQLVASLALPAGEGDLAARLEALKKKLEAEGLFALEKKRPLPRFPRAVGVVTSTSGAAMHDILRVAAERCPVRIVVADCRVQGADAPASIVAAIEAIQRLPELEVVIVGRGGGSAEDLVAFQEEAVVRAIAACRVPVVSAVGHETDVTLADLAADVRAATPSNAAELVVPDRRLLERELESVVRRLERAMDARLDGRRLALEALARKLDDPRTALAAARRRLDESRRRLDTTLPRRLSRERAAFALLERRLLDADPRRRLAERRHRLASLESKLGPAMERVLGERRAALDTRASALSVRGEHLTESRRRALGELAARLDALSPLAVLTRGYAIALDGRGKAIRQASDLAAGDRFVLRLGRGKVRARAESIDE